MITILYSQEKAIKQGFTGHPKTVLAALGVKVYRLDEEYVDKMEHDNYVDILAVVDKMPHYVPEFISETDRTYDMDMTAVQAYLSQALGFADEVRHMATFTAGMRIAGIQPTEKDDQMTGNRTFILTITERMTDEYWIDRHIAQKA